MQHRRHNGYSILGRQYNYYNLCKNINLIYNTGLVWWKYVQRILYNPETIWKLLYFGVDKLNI